MTTASFRIRSLAFHSQGTICCYCDCPMWLVDVEVFAQRFQVTEKIARMFRCTSEHVVARHEGGKLTADNITAACVTCNTRRHRFRPFQAPSFVKFREHVRARIKSGRWHPKEAVNIVSARNAVLSCRFDLIGADESDDQRAGISGPETPRGPLPNAIGTSLDGGCCSAPDAAAQSAIRCQKLA